MLRVEGSRIPECGICGVRCLRFVEREPCSRQSETAYSTTPMVGCTNGSLPGERGIG